MSGMMKKMSENILDKFSMDFLRNQVLKNAYGNDDTLLERRVREWGGGGMVFLRFYPWL